MLRSSLGVTKLGRIRNESIIQLKVTEASPAKFNWKYRVPT